MLLSYVHNVAPFPGQARCTVTVCTVSTFTMWLPCVKKGGLMYLFQKPDVLCVSTFTMWLPCVAERWSEVPGPGEARCTVYSGDKVFGGQAAQGAEGGWLQGALGVRRERGLCWDGHVHQDRPHLRQIWHW